MPDFRHRAVEDTAQTAPSARVRTVTFNTPTEIREEKSAAKFRAVFIPPATRDAAIERRESLVKRIQDHQRWLQNNGRRHHLRVEKVAELDASVDELRRVKSWLHDDYLRTRAEYLAKFHDEKQLLRALSEIIDRLVEAGASLTDEEHATLDVAAAFVGCDEVT